MAPFFPLITAIVIKVLTGLVFMKLGKTFDTECKICKKPTYDTLISDNSFMPSEKNPSGCYCREHLLERYKEAFIKSPYKIVAVELFEEVLKKPTKSYAYFPASELTSFWRFKKEDKAILEALLNSITSKNCQTCSMEATVLFISKAAASSEKYGYGLLSNDFFNFR